MVRWDIPTLDDVWSVPISISTEHAVPRPQWLGKIVLPGNNEFKVEQEFLIWNLEYFHLKVSLQFSTRYFSKKARAFVKVESLGR